MFGPRKKRKNKSVFRERDVVSAVLFTNVADDDGKNYNKSIITKNGVRTFYDRSYTIVLYEGDSAKTCAFNIVRQYEENFDDFIEVAKKCKSVKEMKALDKRNSIYYD